MTVGTERNTTEREEARQMKITVRELKQLIRESVEETMAELEEAPEVEVQAECNTGMEEEKAMEEQLQEAVVAAYRAGMKRGLARNKA